MDRGYLDFKRFHSWTEQKVFFVTRMKENIRYVVSISTDVLRVPDLFPGKKRNIVSDGGISLRGDATSTKYPDELRRIVVRDKEKNEDIVLLTNHFGFGATTIAAIYKDRWEIELFFKALKQNLKVKTFIGTSENALRIQIWTALAPLGGLLFGVPDGTANSPCLHARDLMTSSPVTNSVVLPGHGNDVAAESLHLP